MSESDSGADTDDRAEQKRRKAERGRGRNMPPYRRLAVLGRHGPHLGCGRHRKPKKRKK